jgi:hypothetical protein
MSKLEPVATPTPELDKLAKVAPYSQKIGEFLEWLGDTKNFTLCKLHEHDDSCYEDNSRYPTCQMSDEDYYSVHYSIETLLAEFFKIDLNEIENERRKILEHLRKQK